MNIAITQRVLTHNGVEYDALDSSFYRLFKHHTLHPVPNLVDLNFLLTVATNDMLVISGGDANSIRMHNEIALLMRAIMNNKPVIGICHGALLLTQFLGGEVLDIPGHRNTTHNITYTTDNTEYTVNSFHGSTITSAPKGAKILAIDSENNIECWIKDNIAAILWHPERHTNYSKTFLPTEVSDLYDESSQKSFSSSS